MCNACETAICAIFDALVAGYYRDFPPPMPRSHDGEHVRPKYMQMDVTDAPTVNANFESLAELIKRAPGIGFKPWEFKTELTRRSGFGEQIEAWANQDKIPNGLARKIILSCAEDILLERGAQPRLSLKAA